MIYELKCQGCGVIGELEEYMEEFECPQCGGLMVPTGSTPKAPAAEASKGGEETPTIAISRAQISEYRQIKVAKAVDVGFANMFNTGTTSSALPKTSPHSTVQQRSTGQSVTQQRRAAQPVAPPPPPPEEPEYQEEQAAPEEQEEQAPQQPIPGKPVFKAGPAKKKFTFGAAKAPQQKPPTMTTQSPRPQSSSRPAPSPQQTQKGKLIMPGGKKPPTLKTAAPAQQAPPQQPQQKGKIVFGGTKATTQVAKAPGTSSHAAPNRPQTSQTVLKGKLISPGGTQQSIATNIAQTQSSVPRITAENISAHPSPEHLAELQRIAAAQAAQQLAAMKSQQESERVRREREELERQKQELELLEQRQREQEEFDRLRREREEIERKRKDMEEQERRRREQEEFDRLRREREEIERKRKDMEEQERRRKEMEELERLRREREEIERKRKDMEEQERRRKENEELERKRKEQEEEERKKAQQTVVAPPITVTAPASLEISAPPPASEAPTIKPEEPKKDEAPFISKKEEPASVASTTEKKEEPAIPTLLPAAEKKDESIKDEKKEEPKDAPKIETATSATSSPDKTADASTAPKDEKKDEPKKEESTKDEKKEEKDADKNKAAAAKGKKKPAIGKANAAALSKAIAGSSISKPTETKTIPGLTPEQTAEVLRIAARKKNKARLIIASIVIVIIIVLWFLAIVAKHMGASLASNNGPVVIKADKTPAKTPAPATPSTVAGTTTPAAAAAPAATTDSGNNAMTSPLRESYNKMYSELKLPKRGDKNTDTREIIDQRIKLIEAFMGANASTPDDYYCKEAKKLLKTQKDLRMMY